MNIHIALNQRGSLRSPFVYTLKYKKVNSIIMILIHQVYQAKASSPLCQCISHEGRLDDVHRGCILEKWPCRVPQWKVLSIYSEGSNRILAIHRKEQCIVSWSWVSSWSWYEKKEKRLNSPLVWPELPKGQRTWNNQSNTINLLCNMIVTSLNSLLLPFRCGSPHIGIYRQHREVGLLLWG